jgi:CRP/FNR family transcriptional regulator, cyclic AMP receptor protein
VLAEEDVTGRVVATLLSWAAEYGHATAEGVLIGLRASRRELAQVVGASEKSVDDVLTTLRRVGLVRTGRRRFVVCNAEGGWR